MMCFLFFFFSSRRRHTRSLRDWSSDVCSSDLLHLALDTALDGAIHVQFLDFDIEQVGHTREPVDRIEDFKQFLLFRSEERRVGKECRSRWSPYQSKKNSHTDLRRFYSMYML